MILTPFHEDAHTPRHPISHPGKEERSYVRKFLMVRLRIVYAVIICVWLSMTLPSAAQTPLDPNSLIGEWQGNYTTRSGSSGKVYLTITEATEKTFKGQQEVTTGRIGPINRREAIEGTIEGNVLRWITPGVLSGGVIRNEQTVDGNKMSGFSEGTTRSEVVLQKK